VINENGNIRDLVQDFIRDQKYVKRAYDANKRPKILLIDEVDVFFNKSFYGNNYTPSASLKDDTVVALINMIWKERHNWSDRQGRKSIKTIKSSKEYENCCKKFSGWEFLIEEAVKDMLADINTYQSHDYIVLNDKIGYKEQDGVSFNIAYGYKTMFAYYHEHEKGNVSEPSLLENIAIGINCGEFSYAEIPHEFQGIMGVTGTLKTLSEPEKDIVQNVYKIVKNTYTPSVFGKNQRVFSSGKDIRIETEDDYMTALADEVDNRLQGKIEGPKRAVLIFFETKERLNQFYNSKHFYLRKSRALIISEELSPEEKDLYIKRATMSGQVTLLTKAFGRGTDFICRDPIVISNGGVHVIQTFLSEELSEETQIQGRTARQGNPGSYSMVLLDKDLEKFLINEEDIKAMRDSGNYYDLLNKKRNDYFIQQYGDNKKQIAILKEKHDESNEFVNSILKGKGDKIISFLKKYNKGPPLNHLSRTICLMDATGSMSHLLNNAKNTVGTMFQRAGDVLESQGIDPNSFEIQFVVYRNYNCSEEKLLQCSPWECKPSNLRTFMEKIHPEGGWGNEAIEIGLWHVNQEFTKDEVDQVILIGDAPANSPSEVISKRNGKGESYWKTTKFSVLTDYMKELNVLKERGVKVHAFFVDRHAENNFREIAKTTGGRCEFLDINSPSGAEMLTDLVTEEVLRNVGGDRGDNFVELYRKRYKS